MPKGSKKIIALMSFIIASSLTSEAFTYKPAPSLTPTELAELASTVQKSENVTKDVQAFVLREKMLRIRRKDGTSYYYKTVTQTPLCGNFYIHFRSGLLQSFECVASGGNKFTDATFAKKLFSSVRKGYEGCRSSAKFSTKGTVRTGHLACKGFEVHWHDDTQVAAPEWKATVSWSEASDKNSRKALVHLLTTYLDSSTLPSEIKVASNKASKPSPNPYVLT